METLNSTLRHIADIKVIRGTVKNHGRPLTLGRKIILTNIERRPLRGYVDCENVAEAIRDYIREATGRKIRLTREVRTVLMHLYSLRHQYRKGSPVALSTVFAGYRHKDTVMRLRVALEESGLIRLVNGAWAYNPKDRKQNCAPKYEFAIEFVQLLEVMMSSVLSGRSSGNFIADNHPDTARTIFTVISSLHTKSSDFCAIPPIILDKAPHSDTGRLGHGAFNKGVKVMSERERQNRNKRLQRLWGGMTLDEMKRSGIYDRCRLQCVSLGIGEEVDDFSFMAAMGGRYHEDIYAKIVNECDAGVPPFVSDPVSGASICTRTVWSFMPKRDKNGNIFKAGCRPCNGICATRGENSDEPPKPDEASRRRIMTALHLDHHFDVHCSIHNLGKALVSGKFDHADLYACLARSLGVSRNMAKLGTMHGTFASLAEYCARRPDSGNAAKHVHHKDPKTKEDMVLPFTYRELQDAMKEAGIPIHGRYTEIFWHEAFIYDLVRLYLKREHNVASLRVYDSFYTRNYISERLFISLINRAVGDYLKILADDYASLSFRL